MATRLPSKRRVLTKTPNKKVLVTEERYPYGSEEEFQEFVDNAEVVDDAGDFSCAVAHAVHIDSISSTKEGFMVRRIASTEWGFSKGGLILAVTTESEKRYIGPFLLKAGWKELCLFTSKDGRRILT